MITCRGWQKSKEERKKERRGKRDKRDRYLVQSFVALHYLAQSFVADCFYGDGRGYRGNISSTVSGYKCQVWNEQFPHEHRNLSGEIYEEIRNSSNFCRNPGGYGLNGPCCFTTNRTVRWEYCDVPKCAKLGK